MKARRIKTYLAVSALILVVLGGVGAYLASQPDRDVTFVRDAPTTLPEETLKASMQYLFNWPNWLYSISKVERVDIMGRPFPGGEQSVEKGALIRLTVHPHKGERRGSFEFQVEVTDYIPGRVLEFKVVEDPALKMFRLFDRVQWRIEVLGSPPTQVRGIEVAHTRHWRARLFSAISERVLMHQLFYPNIMALSEFTQPLPQSQYPLYGQ